MGCGGAEGFRKKHLLAIKPHSSEPLPPLLIGFILGGMMENNFARSVNLTDGVAFMYERPMTLGLLIFGLLLIFVPAYRRRRAKALQDGVALGD